MLRVPVLDVRLVGRNEIEHSQIHRSLREEEAMRSVVDLLAWVVPCSY
jgi:hypothetical protein